MAPWDNYDAMRAIFDATLFFRTFFTHTEKNIGDQPPGRLVHDHVKKNEESWFFWVRCHFILFYS